jgi:hypothetical protein
MNQASALFAALEAAASLGGAKFDPLRVEALAGAIGLEREKLPALVSQLQKAGKVAIGWGGVVEVLPEQGTVVFNLQGASVGPGATFAGRDAHGATIHITQERAFGALAAVIERLQSVRPGLSDDAAAVADKTIDTLKAWPSAEAPSETRSRWAGEATTWLSRLLVAAPLVKDAVELGEDVVKGLGWS